MRAARRTIVVRVETLRYNTNQEVNGVCVSVKRTIRIHERKVQVVARRMWLSRRQVGHGPRHNDEDWGVDEGFDDSLHDLPHIALINIEVHGRGGTRWRWAKARSLRTDSASIYIVDCLLTGPGRRGSPNIADAVISNSRLVDTLSRLNYVLCGPTTISKAKWSKVGSPVPST